jgi:hypothetical protein
MRKFVILGCRAHGQQHSPLMTRYTLLKTRFGDVKIHVFHRSDGPELHDHPWPFWSLVVWRGYIEESLTHNEGGTFETFRRRRRPLSIVRRRPEHAHRVELIAERPAVTIVWTGRRVREWGFYTRRGWQWFREYFIERGC